MVEQRYGVLRLIAVVLKVLAWLVLLAGVVFSVVAIVQGGALGAMPGPHRMGSAMFGGGFAVVIAVFYFIMLYAWAEGILVVLGIEENTRLTAERLAERGPQQ